MREKLVELLKLKNIHIDDFRTATLSCVTNIEDLEDDLAKADKYVEFVNNREESLSEIKKIIKEIDESAELKNLYESNDEEIVALNKKYDRIKEEVKKLQPKMNEVGQEVLTEMRSEFKKIKQKQSFNKAYFDSPYTSGTKFDVKQ